jgi:hypothetical protein
VHSRLCCYCLVHLGFVLVTEQATETHAFKKPEYLIKSKSVQLKTNKESKYHCSSYVYPVGRRCCALEDLVKADILSSALGTLADSERLDVAILTDLLGPHLGVEQAGFAVHMGAATHVGVLHSVKANGALRC